MNFLLHGFGDTPTVTQYSHIALDDCNANGCRADALTGFPVWSPDGRRTILQWQHYFLQLGDHNANPSKALGDGFSPFWIDNNHYGYLRFIEESDFEKMKGGMEIVIAGLDQTPQRLLTINDFVASDPQEQSVTDYISYVSVNPANPHQLYVALRSYSDQNQRVKIYSVLLKESAETLVVDQITPQLILDGAIVGYPSLVVPNGFIPFVLSPDGRWITANRPSPDTADTWLIYAHDTQQQQTHIYTISYPSSMFIHPYYDWSRDSNWLVIIDQNYLRLIAPAHNYERLITHDLQNCSHPAWVNPIN